MNGHAHPHNLHQQQHRLPGHHHHHPHHHHRLERQRSASLSLDWPEDLVSPGKFHPDAIETKDVIVIGNGPSAITLSFLLSGRWPYYRANGEPHPIDFLHERLTFQGPEKSLIECNLDQLSQGLTGRSLNRVSVLFDQLQNPNTDFGHRQESTLEWKYHPDKAVDHLVLGMGLPGGLWYSLRKSKTILTVSRQKWMQLPEMEIPEGEDEDDENQDSENSNPLPSSPEYGRISFDSIAKYYRSYVDNFSLSKYFRNQTRVIRVDWCSGLNCWIVDAVTKKCVPGSAKHCPLFSHSNHLIKHLNCITKLRCTAKDIKFVRTRFLAKRIVLATGANACSPSLLNVPGEGAHFVIHSLDQLDSILKSSKAKSTIARSLGPPGCAAPPTPQTILIVGSGLSAADALNMIDSTQSSTFRVIHIFRRSIQDRGLIFNQLSNKNLYPEYAQVFARMKQSIKSPECISCFLKSSSSSSTYQAYHRCALTHIAPGPNRSASVEFLDAASSSDLCSNCNRLLHHRTTFPINLVLVLIGSKPALDFLPEPLVNKLGLIQHQSIDIRENPIRINTVTHEAMAAKNLYAIGPLVGDNFVRFVQGGAFAVAADLNAKKAEDKKNKSDKSNGHCLI